MFTQPFIIGNAEILSIGPLEVRGCLCMAAISCKLKLDRPPDLLSCDNDDTNQC